MGIRLYVEVLDYAPPSLTHREKLLLAVLAEDANDDSRTTWGSVESERNLRRAQLSRSQLYAVIKKLIEKGALERASAGQKHAAAKYRIPPLAPVGADLSVRDSGTLNDSQSPASADTDEPQRPGIRDAEPPSQCQQNADTDSSQCPQIRDVSVPESGTPTPPPSSQPTSQLAGGGYDYGIPPDARPLVDGITAANVNVRWPFQGDQWFPVLALIAKCGVDAMVEYAIKAARRANPDSARYFMRGWAELPPLPPPDTPRPRLRAVSGDWQPYRNPDDDSVYLNGW